MFEMNEFNANYMDLRRNYFEKKSKIERNRRINLNQTKQKISEYFCELYLLIKESENALYSQLNELYKVQTIKNEQSAINESNDDDQLQNMAAQHLHYLSRNIERYE